MGDQETAARHAPIKIQGANAETIRNLLARLDDRNSLDRAAARRELVLMGDRALPALVQVLSGVNKESRREAASGLAELAGPAAVPTLVASLNDRDEDIRWIAAEGLIKAGRPAIEPLLRELMLHPDEPALRMMARHVLNHFSGGDRDAQHHAERHPSLKGLQQFKEIAAPVVAALDDTDAEVHAPLAARDALEKLGVAPPPLPARPRRRRR